VSAFGTPAASAAPIEDIVPSTTNGEPSGQQVPVRVVQVGADNGFDWGDAGIGAGGLLAIAAIGCRGRNPVPAKHPSHRRVSAASSAAASFSP